MRFFIGRPEMRRGQSFVEYTLLAAVALVGLLIVGKSFLDGTVKSGFTGHFNETKRHITGGQSVE
jgi:Flp pilus assembly pilin Flp